MHSAFCNWAQLRYFLLIAATTFQIGTIEASEPATSESANGWGKIALLVGINDYKSNDISDLRGCENDVMQVKNLLVGKFEFPDTNVITLLGTQATHAQIVKAIKEHLIDKAKAYKEATGKKAIVVFDYSGHGSQVPDTSGDELDGRDETIVPQDSLKPEDDITDDELNGLFTELAKVTDNVTYIFDSCHSGTVTKGTGQPRIVERNLPPVAARGTGGDTEENTAFALITGCRSDQRSYEFEENGKFYGTLTYFLTRIANASGDEGLTYRDLMDQLRQDVGHARPQEPQLFGAKIDSFLFGEANSVAQPFVLVNPDNNEVVVAAGEAQGLAPKSKLNVYAPKTKKFDSSAMRIAEIEITSSDAFESRAKILSGGPIPKAARAIITVLGMRWRPFPVFFDMDAKTHDDAKPDIATLNKIKAAILADEDMKENFELTDVLDKAKLTVSVRSDNKIYVAGNHIQSSPIAVADTDAVKRVLAQLLHWAKWYNLLTLKNSNPELNVDFTISGPDRPAGKDGVKTFFDKDPVEIKVTNRSNVPVYFVVLDLGADGSVSQIYPDNGATEKLPPNSHWSTKTKAFVPADNDSTFDHIKVLVFDRNVDTYFLTTNAAPKGVEGSPFAGAVFKGSKGIEPIVPKSWTTAYELLKVTKPK